ncbi:Lsr2 [Clavibacter michiganensis subsp. michiganensis]|uniref:Lsr2 dimerization domain-containing protein n=1 Tax=Clavibacter michiganensis TaxID=28447 RepID=UPI000B6FF5DA|nr:histone-like nucleoid-structuring protein Lsr2 [Clavibacter michiganensis]OUE03098.1 Lsr2 [Clavibacter michiganensis subsp. michiganensis]
MTDDVDPRDDSTDSTTEAVRFGLDGIVHEIDLDPAEARALRAALAPYVAAGRRTTVTITAIRDEPARASGAGPRLARGQRPQARPGRPHLGDAHDALPRPRRALTRAQRRRPPPHGTMDP